MTAGSWGLLRASAPHSRVGSCLAEPVDQMLPTEKLDDFVGAVVLRGVTPVHGGWDYRGPSMVLVFGGAMLGPVDIQDR